MSMTSLASSPGTAVEPMWSMRMARCPHAVFEPRHDPARLVRPRRVGGHQPRRSGARVVRVCRLCANGRMRSYHSSRACSTSSPALPELSSHTSATARRCSSVACAAMRARASSSLKPRYSMSRVDAKLLVGVDDHHQREHRRHTGLDQQRDVLDDHGVLGGAAAINSDAPLRHQRMHDPVQRLRASRRR